MHAKAAALYDQAARLASHIESSRARLFYSLGYDALTSILANPSTQQRIVGIDARIESFKRSIPPLDRVDPNRPDVLRSLAVVHLLTRCALIKLHMPLMNEPGSNERAISATRSIVGILRGLGTSGIDVVNPIMGVSKYL